MVNNKKKRGIEPLFDNRTGPKNNMGIMNQSRDNRDLKETNGWVLVTLLITNQAKYPISIKISGCLKKPESIMGAFN